MGKSKSVIVLLVLGIAALLKDASTLVSVPEVFADLLGGVAWVDASLSDKEAILIGVGLLVLTAFTLGLELRRRDGPRKRVAAGALLLCLGCAALVVPSLDRPPKDKNPPVAVGQNRVVASPHEKSQSDRDRSAVSGTTEAESPSAGPSPETEPIASVSSPQKDESSSPSSSCACSSVRASPPPQPEGSGVAGVHAEKNWEESENEFEEEFEEEESEFEEEE